MMRLNRKSSKSKQPSKVRAAMVVFTVFSTLGLYSVLFYVNSTFHPAKNFLSREFFQRMQYRGK